MTTTEVFSTQSFLLSKNCSYLLKVLLFFLGVSVVKSHDELPLKGELVVLVEQRGLGMANMEVTENRKKIQFIDLPTILTHFFFFLKITLTCAVYGHLCCK